MKRKNVIIYMTPVPECWGNLKHFCEAKGISYNTFNRKPMPFEVNGYEVHKVPFLTGTIVPEAMLNRSTTVALAANEQVYV